MIDLALAILTATAGQILLSHHDLRGLGLYALAVLLLLVWLRRDEHGRGANPWPCRAPCRGPAGPGTAGGQIGDSHLASTEPSSPPQPMRDRSRVWYRRLWRPLLLPLALANAVLAFLAASDNTYRWYGVVAWLLAVGLFLLIFWEREAGRSPERRLGLSRAGWQLSWTTLAVIGLILIGFWFRFWRLAELPPEMTSDHVEKLLDMHDLVTGQRPIFFVRNTGREPWQFYWTLMFIRLFDLDTKFFALKLGTAVVGLLALPGVYLLGRELFGRWVGLWATLFTAVATWPVILSRIGLRFPFAPAATAWSLLYLLRGRRDGRRNDFLLLGLWLGIGLHGYTAFRAMPLAVLACWSVYLLRPSSPKAALRPSSFVRNALLTVLIALVVFIPLGRFALEHPDDFWRRSVSRMADPNQPTPDGVPLTFLKNLWNLALMFHWKGDDVWVNTLADAPVLDPLLGGLLVLGLVIALWRGLRLRDPIAPLLLVAGAILLLPSALSLAYPIENPSVVRSAGAIPAVMVIAALPIGLGLERGSMTLRGWRRRLLILGGLVLAIAVIAINYQRYFGDYWQQYQRRALNTTEVAAAIHGFGDSGGDLANAWIVAWPYWLDTRGAGIELGDPTWNNVILNVAELDTHVAGPRPRYYVLHPADAQALARLQELFPLGWSSLYISERPSGNFVRFYVPPETPGLSPSPHASVGRSENDFLKGRDTHAP
jgi:hypothetical protein